MTETQTVKIRVGDHRVKIADPHGNTVSRGSEQKRVKGPHRFSEKELELDFGCALEAMRNGKAIWRSGSRGRVYLVEFNSPELTAPLRMVVEQDAQGRMSQWSPSAEDLLALDWCFGNVE